MRALAIVSLVLLPGCDRSTPAAQAPTPNVLLVTIDTLRPDHLGAYGYTRPTSPNLDRIAAEGALFETAYAPMGTTAPSHATMLTSRYPLGHGVVRNGIPLRDEVPVLPALLAESGYRTAAFVSSYPVSHRFGLARGFALFDDDFRGPVSLDIARWNRQAVEGQFDRLGSVTVDRTLAWLATDGPSTPWFVWVHLFDPHSPYRAPQPFGTAFASADASNRQLALDAYDGEILYADAQVGRLLSGMTEGAGERGLLTIVTSDHGEAFWEHGRHGHNRDLFDEEVRVPLIVHWPGRVAAGQRIAEPVHLVDLMPTIAAAARLRVADLEVAGIDLLPALAGDDRIDRARSLYLQRPDFRRSTRPRRHLPESFGVRVGHWKLLQSRRVEPLALYDVAADPGETRNLASAERERVAALAARLAAWRKIESARAPAHEAEPVPDDVQRKLRALGYAD